MNTFSLIWKYIIDRPLNTLLNVMLLSLGMLIVDLLFVFSQQLDENLSKNTRGIDLVVGAKGSPMQIVLSSVFYVDFPTGNIMLKEVEKLTKNRNVKQVIPLALGDAYNGFRIVGTTISYLDIYEAEIDEGNDWQGELEVIVGAAVAKELKFNVGDEFSGQHGLSGGYKHDHSHYKVAGVLKATGSIIDQLILTSVESVWKVHDDAEEILFIQDTLPKLMSRIVPTVNLNSEDSLKEITSAIIKYRSPMAAMQLPAYINGKTNFQAASPAMETSRLFSIVGVGVDVIEKFAYLIVLVAMLSVFIALYNALKERKYDMAIMRAMGASKTKLFGNLISEGIFTVFIGGALGIIISHGIVELITVIYSNSRAMGLSGAVFYLEELYLLLGIVVVGVVAALIPAFGVYKVDISKILSED